MELSGKQILVQAVCELSKQPKLSRAEMLPGDVWSLLALEVFRQATCQEYCRDKLDHGNYEDLNRRVWGSWLQVQPLLAFRALEASEHHTCHLACSLWLCVLPSRSVLWLLPRGRSRVQGEETKGKIPVCLGPVSTGHQLLDGCLLQVLLFL